MYTVAVIIITIIKCKKTHFAHIKSIPCRAVEEVIVITHESDQYELEIIANGDMMHKMFLYNLCDCAVNELCQGKLSSSLLRFQQCRMKRESGMRDNL